MVAEGMGIRNRLFRSFLGVGAIRLASIPLSLGTSVLLARVLGPEAFGRYAFAMALVPLISLLVSGGLRQLLMREVAACAHGGQWSQYRGIVRTAHLWVLTMSALLLALYWLCAGVVGLIPVEGKWAHLAIAIWIVPLSSLASVRTGTVKGLGMPAWAELPAQLVQPCVALFIFGGLAFYQYLDEATALWGQVGAASLAFVVATAMFMKVQPGGAKSAVPEFRYRNWAFSLFPFTLLVLISTFNSQLGIVVLGVLGTDEQVAAMRVAEKGGQFVALALTLVNLVIAPAIVRAHRDGDRKQLQKLAWFSARGGLAMALPVALVFIGFGHWLVGLIFGESYSGIAYWPLVIICCGQLANVFFGSVGYFLSMSGFERDLVRTQVLAVACNLGLCVLLVPSFGAVGAAVGTSVGLLVWNVILAWRVYRRLGIRTFCF